MTKRKKNLAVLAGGALSMLMTVGIFAADTSLKEITSVEPGSNAAQFEATGSYTEDTVLTKYRVEIIWGSMDFDYQAPSSSWNTDTLTYEADTGSAEGFQPQNDRVSNAFSITNHSNIRVNSKINFYGAEADGVSISEAIEGKFAVMTGYEDIIMSDAIEQSMPSAAMVGFQPIDPSDTETQGKPYTMNYKLNITGGALMQSDTPVSIGTITVTLE